MTPLPAKSERPVAGAVTGNAVYVLHEALRLAQLRDDDWTDHDSASLRLLLDVTGWKDEL